MVLIQCVLSQGLALSLVRFWNWTTSLSFSRFRLFALEWSRDNRNLENNGRILDKARIKYPDSKYLDILGELIPFADFARVPHVDTSDLEALDLVKRRAAESVSDK